MRVQLMALALLAALLLGPASAQEPAEQCFPETGKCVHGSFLTYWRANGGLRQQGLPITDEFKEGTLTVQYFERARFEHHPEFTGTPNEVLLGLLGREQYTAKYETPPPISPITLNGTGTMNTAQFTLATGTYRATWTANSGSQSSCFFGSTLRTAADTSVETIGSVTPKTGEKLTGETFVYNVKAGPHFLSATSNGCNWSVTLTQQP